MNLEEIINIAGKPGLYKVVSKGKNSVIVESLTDGQRGPLYSNNQANMLEEIGIYTYDDTKPLSEIFDDIAKKENCKQSISHKCSKDDLTNYFREILTDYDEERVYISNIKKVFQWYNIMQNNGLIKVLKEDKRTTKTSIKEIKTEEK